MRGVSVFISCFLGLFSLLSLQGEGLKEEQKLPLTLFTPQLSQKELRLKLEEKNLNPSSFTRPLFFSAYYAPPHEEMQKRALQTGSHAFFSSVYSDFVAHHAPSNPFVTNDITWLSFSPASCWQSVTRLDWVLSSFSSLERDSLLWIGADFALLWHPKLSGGEEKRAISPEDLGFSLAPIPREHDTPQEQIPSGRFIFTAKPWPALATHRGKWVPNTAPERMKFDGALVLGPHFIWENGTQWNHAPLPENDPALLALIFSQANFYAQWWQNALPKIQETHPFTLNTKDTLCLDFNHWQASFLSPGLSYEPPLGREKWCYPLWQECAQKALSPPSLKSAKTPEDGPLGLGGSWNINIEKEGHYEIVASFLPRSPNAKPSFALGAGEALVRCGQVIGKMKVLTGATEFSLGLDLFAGDQRLEINIAQSPRSTQKHASDSPPKTSQALEKKQTGTLSPEVFITPPFVTLRYKGPRKSPHIKF